jgi:hypothetical protein
MSRVTGNKHIASHMRIAPAVETFLVGGNVFRTAFSMTSRLQGRVNSPLRETVLVPRIQKALSSNLGMAWCLVKCEGQLLPVPFVNVGLLMTQVCTVASCCVYDTVSYSCSQSLWHDVCLCFLQLHYCVVLLTPDVIFEQHVSTINWSSSDSSYTVLFTQAAVLSCYTFLCEVRWCTHEYFNPTQHV